MDADKILAEIQRIKARMSEMLESIEARSGPSYADSVLRTADTIRFLYALAKLADDPVLFNLAKDAGKDIMLLGLRAANPGVSPRDLIGPRLDQFDADLRILTEAAIQGERNLSKEIFK